MTNPKAYITLVLIHILSFSSTVFGQHKSVEADSLFQDKIESIWNEIEQSGNADSLLTDRSNYLYEYYLQHQGNPNGKYALEQAFLMWSYTGNTQHLEEILNELKFDSKIWAKIIPHLVMIFQNSEDVSLTDYMDLLEYLSTQITDPEGKSAAMFALLLSPQVNNDRERAVGLAQKLVELNASDFYAEEGLRYLNELESLNIGQRAPDFTVINLAGKEISLSDFNGQFIVLEFWATWCSPCLANIHPLKTLWDEYGDDKLTIIALSIDRDKEALTSFLKENDLPWPQVFLTGETKEKVLDLYSVAGIPKMYLLDPNGVILEKDLKDEDMISNIRKHLEQ